MTAGGEVMQSDAAPVCRLCDSKRTRCLGTIPDSDYFAGRVLSCPIMGGQLWACDSCYSMFRYPVLSDSTYLHLYADGTENGWSSDNGRNDLARVGAIIAEKGGAPSVLDVGCGSGNFLLHS